MNPVTQSSQFDTQKQALLENIDKSNKIIDMILNNLSLDVASSEQLGKLRQILNRNKVFQHKLTSNEFEVAIVGLEKAGKSTFANALIDNDVLPSAPERCTFTTTRLVSGADKATVEFYTESEFEYIFKEMLKEIEFPNLEMVSFKTLEKDIFETYFNNLETNNPSLYKSHVGKTNEEILDIIACRNKLRLDGQKIEFHGDELNQDDFKEYIKGRANDTSKPRSVKRIEIESSKLQQMQNIIMYDVPGFDSPTQLHIRQTEERLKKADAIILVTNVGTNPSIQGTSLNVIRNNTDEDGIALKDKLFVFGNQIDRVNTEEQLQGNENILRNDVKKYNIGEDKRVFVGSALMYLDKNHQTKFKDLQDNIETIRQALIDYYQTERFELLKKKVYGNQRELKLLLGDIVNTQATHGDIIIDENILKSKILHTEIKNIENRLRTDLQDFFVMLKKYISEDKWLSERMKEELADERYFKPIDEKYFWKIQRLTDSSLRLNVQFEKVNFDIREQLHLKYLEEYLAIIKNITSKKCKSVEIHLNQTFAKAVCGNVIVTDEIHQQCQALIQQITKDVSHHSDRFHYLIEHFSRDLFDIMLSSPIASSDRLERYKKSSHDIRHLDYYYSKGKGKLINLVLSQKDENLVDYISEIGNYATQLAVMGKSTFDEKSLIRLKEISDFFNFVKPEVIISDGLGIDVLLKEKMLKSSQSAEEVVHEINQDLNNLRKVLIKAVVPAIDLEVAFLNGIDRQIKLLLSAMNDNNVHSQVFHRFIAEIAVLVKKSELDNISQIIERQKLKKELIEKIAELAK